jgi:hypothetical protein
MMVAMVVKSGLGDGDLLGRTQLVQGGLLEAQTHFLGDHGAAGQDGDVFQHGLAAVAEARGLDGADLDDAADGVDQQRGQGLTFDVLGDDQQGLAGLGDGFQHRQHLAHVADLLVVQQHVGLFQVDAHGLLVVDEVRRKVAAVELHALDQRLLLAGHDRVQI